MPLPPIRPISATTLSHYIRLDQCDRYLRFRLDRPTANALFAQYKALGVRAEQPLTPLLREAGQRFEERVLALLPPPVIDLRGSDAMVTAQVLAALVPDQRYYLVQATLAAEVGGWPCVGCADIVQATRRPDGILDLWIADIKASQHDRVEYRLQVTFYARLLRAMLRDCGITPGTVTGAILRTNPQHALPTLDQPDQEFDLVAYDLILDQLLEGPDAAVRRVLYAPFEQLAYHLGYKCDSCMFNQLCMVDSAVRQDVALVPFITPAAVQALRAAQVGTAPGLAALKLLPDPPQWNTALLPTPGHEALVMRLQGTLTLGPQLDRLVQRARAVAHQVDPQIASYARLLDAGPSRLPADATNPDLVKIFLDGQQDYVQGYLYLAGALVQGPRGSVPLVAMTAGPPDAAAEADLVVRLLTDVLAAVPHVARASGAAPIHVYIYDPSEQQIWLDALDRHLERLCTLPLFYDLLTVNPGLDQPMLTVLLAEVRERRNLGSTCQNLYRVATALGFAWRTPQDDFRRLFYLRVFDNRTRGPNGRWIEKASRFSSAIPLEYAYGAWGTLPDDPSNEALITYYRRCWPDALRRFQTHRLRALAHIETALRSKNGQLVKLPVDLAAGTTSPPAGLAGALIAFLALEHHTALQERLALYALPIIRRAQTGRAALLQCLSVEQQGGDLIAHCRIDFAGVGLDAAADPPLRLKEGDWTVVSPVGDQSPWQTVHGRVAVITRLAGDGLDLRLLGLTHHRSQFKYAHDVRLIPVPGDRYTLDEMADDLNFDKYREAIQHAATNAFFQRLATPAAVPTPGLRSGRMDQFLRAIRALRTSPLTGAQEAVVADYHAAALLGVQGPPGSGKTATLGWAVLARLFAQDTRPLRVAVCARTHKATILVLAGIADKLQRLAGTPEGRALGRVAVYKVGGDLADPLPPGVRALDAFAGTGLLSDDLAAPLLVLGGTPGGLATLLRRQAGGTLDWTRKWFHLLVIDEASQMSLPEAVLAGAFLRPDGQVLVVGDHRQLPPILAHPWQQERGRATLAHAPHRSLFESLTATQWPIVRLDESFRLHRVHAAFLAQHIYRADGIAFHSRREALLPPLRGPLDPYIAAALDPAYPVIVIEHDEAASQQCNLVEIALAAPLIRACVDGLQLDAREGIGIVVPHRAQKAALGLAFPALAQAQAIDTVERFQGGERDVIVVSATASDPGYLRAEAAFLFNRNRLNVAISRPRRKLIVLAARSVFCLLTDDLDLFEHLLLWKFLRYHHTDTLLWEGYRAGATVRVFGRHCGHALPALIPAIPSAVMIPPPVYIRRERRKEAW